MQDVSRDNMDKAWKAFERRIAKRVGGKRLACHWRDATA